MIASPDGRADDLVATLRSAGCVFAEDEAELLRATAASAAELDRMVAERVSGVPLEHVLGWVEFCGMRVAVERGVFVPRKRTELLVAEALRRVPHPGIAVELCCGAGAVALALAAAAGEVHAVDVEPAAVACARRNLASAGPRHHAYLGDLYSGLPGALRGRVDLLVANAPYVPTDAIAFMPPEAREHEPAIALDGGADGLEVHRRIAAEAPHWLAPAGVLLIETSDRQADGTAAAAQHAGLRTEVVRDDEATVVAAFR
ncbi:MAG TPA: putative protein N(5)-glutamine methyltransferase [Jatrophihabitantaceae bacterium]|jgi:release factor glutamine methyltransferase